jgi:hypothetical protein
LLYQLNLDNSLGLLQGNWYRKFLPTPDISGITMKIMCLLSAALLSTLGGCAANSAGSTGAVFYTSSGQHITAATNPEYTNGRYEFVDAAGAKQSLSLSQIMSVSHR